jgi:hypothetical protein
VRDAIRKDPGGEGLAVFVVWIDILPADSVEAAREMSRLFRRDAQVRQFHDPARRVGLALAREAFPGYLETAAAALSEDDPLAAAIDRAEGAPPIWDAYLFYDPGVSWTDRIPAPGRWVVQVGYEEDGPSRLWMDDFSRPPADGDLVKILRDLVREQLARSEEDDRRRRPRTGPLRVPGDRP